MSQFRNKKIDTGVVDEWFFRINDQGAIPGDDVVAEDPNDLAQAIADTQELLVHATIYAPADLIDPAHGVLERIKIIEDTFGTTSLQDAYENGNYINPIPGTNLILGPGGVVEIDSNGNLMFNPSTMRIYSGSQQLNFSHNSINTSTNNLTVGTSGVTRDFTLTAGNDMFLKDRYLASAIRLSQSGSTALATIAQSIVGAINELKAGATNTSLQQIYNQSAPPKITTNLSGGKFIVENGTGNPLTPAFEAIGRINVTSTAKVAALEVGSGVTVNATVASNGIITTNNNIVTTTEVRTPTVRAAVGSLNLADTLGSALLTSALDPALLTVKKTIFGAINELHLITTANSSALAAFDAQHDSVTGEHKIITTRADAGQNAIDRIIVENDLGTDVIRMNALGEIRASNFILPSYDLASEALANETHRNGDGTDHSAFASHISAANPHNTVRRVQVQGEPLLFGDVVFKQGPGVTLTQVGQEIEVSAAAGSTIQGVYDTQPTGVLQVHAGKELHIQNDLNNGVASFEQDGSYFLQNIFMRLGANISSDNNLTVGSAATLNLSSVNSDVNITSPLGQVSIQGVPFAQIGSTSLPVYFPASIVETVVDDYSEKFGFYTNNSNSTIFKGTPITVNYDGTIWSPLATNDIQKYTTEDVDWLKSALGVADEDIAPAAVGRVKLSGNITADIGAMNLLPVGEFQVGDTLYVSRKGYGQVRFATPVNNNTVTVDGVVFTAKSGSPVAASGEFQINASPNANIREHETAISMLEAIAAYPAAASMLGRLSGQKASAYGYLTSNLTVGDQLTIGGVTELGSQSVVLSAVASITAKNQFLVGPTLEATVQNIVAAINANSALRQDNTNGHFCHAEPMGSTFKITAKPKTSLGNMITLSSSTANMTVAANLSGGQTAVRITFINMVATGKTISTSNPAQITVANFTSDDSLSHYTAARFLSELSRPVNEDDKFIKVGKVVDIDGSGFPVIKIEIEDRDVFKA